MDTLLEKVKKNLILEHSADDELLTMYIAAAVSYAESYQHIPEGTYSEKEMPPTTERRSSCLPAISTNRGTAPRAAFSRITSRRGSRSGTRSTCCSVSTGNGRCSG